MSVFQSFPHSRLMIQQVRKSAHFQVTREASWLSGDFSLDLPGVNPTPK